MLRFHFRNGMIVGVLTCRAAGETEEVVLIV